MTNAPITALSDAELLVEVRRSAASERAATAHLIEILSELDARRLYLGEGCSSLFTYCTQVLHLSEHAAYNRIEAARLARRMPQVLEPLRQGDITLTAVCLLGRHLTISNHNELLEAARHKSKREVEQLVASLAPKPDVPSTVRKLPGCRPADDRHAEDPERIQQHTAPDPPAVSRDVRRPLPSECPAQPRTDAEITRAGTNPDVQVTLPSISPTPHVRPTVIAPLAPERYKIQFTASREVHDKLRRAQDLLRHAIPDGDIAMIIDRALTMLVKELERRKFAVATRPRPAPSMTSQTRYIPAVVKRHVWARDGGQCAFVGTHGRCTERGFLEFHHVVPFAVGGETIADNLVLACRAHNGYEAEQFFGPLFARENQFVYAVDAARSGTST